MSERKIVRPVPTKPPKMPDGRAIPVISKEEVDAFFAAILGGLLKARLLRENAKRDGAMSGTTTEGGTMHDHDPSAMDGESCICSMCMRIKEARAALSAADRPEGTCSWCDLHGSCDPPNCPKRADRPEGTTPGGDDAMQKTSTGRSA